MKVTISYEFDDEESAREFVIGDMTTRKATSVATVTSAATDTEITADAEGMPYDASVHADPPSLTKDGMWRAARGKADAAAEARAAWKAAGGNVSPPDDLPAADPVQEAVDQMTDARMDQPAPVAAPVVAAPVVAAPVVAAPVPAPVPAPVNTLPPDMLAPVSLERLYDALARAAGAGVDIGVIYDEICATRDPAAVGQALMTNESMRSQMLRHLEGIGIAA